MWRKGGGRGKKGNQVVGIDARPSEGGGGRRLSSTMKFELGGSNDSVRLMHFGNEKREVSIFVLLHKREEKGGRNISRDKKLSAVSLVATASWICGRGEEKKGTTTSQCTFL